MTTLQEKAEYIDFKLDDDGLDGVVQKCLEWVHELDPNLASEIEVWSQVHDQLYGRLRELVKPYLPEDGD